MAKTGYGYPETTKPIGTGPNWVTKVGGLPMYIRRIANRLIHDKDMPEEKAIPIAVAAAKRMCETGESNFGQVNPHSREEACKAVAEWEAKRAASHAKKS